MIPREQALTSLAADAFDVVVIGGGITGAGCALDAAARGYSVALVEKGDYAGGTSSRSSKLVHGGLRYLQNFDLGLVREALLERQLMVKLAPHLVKPLPLVVAAFDGKRLDRATGVGLNLYDVMSVDKLRGRRKKAQQEEFADWAPERHRTISGEEVVEHLPALVGREPTSGYLFYDCQTDDARLVLTVLREAQRFGAVCANRCEVLELIQDELVTGGPARAAGVRVRDSETGTVFELRADNVINATGVWADRIRPDELHDEAEVPVIKPSRGTHIVLTQEQIPLSSGAIVPAGGGRFIFALPWLGRTLIGTTDDDVDLTEFDHVRAAADDVAYLLEATNAFFGTELTADDICGTFAGVRPLISTGDPKKSVDISRKAELYETSSGMITITGGKLTTWRRMAKSAVDRMVDRDARDAPCRTHEIPLGQAVDPDELPRIEGVPPDAYERLAGRYGHVAHEVLAIAAERGELAQPIVADAPPELLAEVVFAARREQARSIGDALLRRSRLGLLAAAATVDPVVTERVARAMAPELGWDEERIAAEIRAYVDEVAAEGLIAADIIATAA